ncbi:MAG: ATPase, T2SS/T4P/T4SS family [Brevundimonas sp.]
MAAARLEGKLPVTPEEERQSAQPLRDRIVVGELRHGAAALESLKAWNTGHPGGLSTAHANSAAETVARLEDLTAEVSARSVRRAILQAVDVMYSPTRRISDFEIWNAGPVCAGEALP